MASAKERAQELAREIREAMRTARAASAHAKKASEEFKGVLVQVQAEAATSVVEYPPGRYECKACHQPVIFSETQRTLPPCDSCGSGSGYAGPPPKVLRVIPPAPRKFPAGLYQCAKCHAPVALVDASDTFAPCEFCGAKKFRVL